jgi:hypothetical protein
MKQIYRHGELLLKPDVLPEGAILSEESNKYIVAHSETGHHHILETTDMSKVKIYTFMGDRFIEIPSEANLWHQKSGKDVHTTHKIAPAVYKVIIKKEFDYFAGVLRAVRD